ncbi:MAG: signal recognition particle protein [Oceanidesulfovibrio sp.]
MFESLSDRLNGVFKKFRGQGRLDEENIRAGLREVRLALLEADVNYKVVKEFVDRVRERAMGQDVLKSLTPGQQVVKIVHDELVDLLGGEHQDLELRAKGPAIIMMVGLQGSGKTTTTGKLALHLRKDRKMNPLMVPADVYRPAAIEQLMSLGRQLDMPVFESTSQMNPVDIAKNAVAQAESNGQDVVLLDTAGRLHVDEHLMEELANIKAAVSPKEILFVADAMTGQDAVNVAQSFNDLLDISGIVLTKMDGDARGGAALSIKSVTDKPIKFVGLGEKLSELEVFHPDRIAGRILGMGDVMTLIEKAQTEIDEEEAEALGKKMQRAEFDFEDFRTQMRRLKKLGSLDSLMKLIPGMGSVREKLGDMNVHEKELGRVEAMINSMTVQERKQPKIINPSRRERIARGSGVDVQDVNQLIKNFDNMQKMMKKMMGGGSKGKKKRMPQLPGMGGGMPGLEGMGGMGGLPGMEGMPGMEGGGAPKRSGSTKADRKKKKLKRKQRKQKK